MMKPFDFSNSKAMKRMFPDILCILTIAALAFAFAGKPRLDSTPQLKAAAACPAKTEPRAAQAEAQGIVRPVQAVKALQERNIFTAAGSYSDMPGKTLPEQPYLLISILNGKEKKAVFKDYTGAVITQSAGKKMIDGFEISRIDSVSVTLKRQAETKTLRMFSGGASAAPGTLPGNSLQRSNTLIGVLGGRVKKAVIRESTGATSILAVGEKLGDGSVITAIEPVGVTLKRGKEKIELRIFGGRSS